MNSEQNVARRFEEERRDALNELQDLLAAAEKRGELTETDRKRKDELQRKLNYIELKTEHRGAPAIVGDGYGGASSEQDRDLLDFFRNPNRRSVELSLTNVPAEEIQQSFRKMEEPARTSTSAPTRPAEAPSRRTSSTVCIRRWCGTRRCCALARRCRVVERDPVVDDLPMPP
jgi:hypothetical protein